MDIRIKKADRTITVRWDDFNDEVRDYVIRYGMTQILNDCHSQLTKDKPDFSPENVMALVEKKLAAMYAGDLRVKRGESDRDPIGEMMIDIATNRIKAAARAKGVKLDKDDLKARVANYVRQHADKLRAEAESIVNADFDL